jgi:hypothetical protein
MTTLTTSSLLYKGVDEMRVATLQPPGNVATHPKPHEFPHSWGFPFADFFYAVSAWKRSRPLEIAAEGKTRYAIDLTNVGV